MGYRNCAIADFILVDCGSVRGFSSCNVCPKSRIARYFTAFTSDDENSGLWIFESGGIAPTGSFEGTSIFKQLAHFQQFGVFLDGKQWVEQKVSLLAEMEILKKAMELNVKGFDKFTEGERNLIEWIGK